MIGRESSPFDAETSHLFERGLLFVDATHIGHPRTSPERAAQFIQLFGCSRGVDFHTPIIEVARIALDPEIVCNLLHEVSEPYTLNAPANEIPLRRQYAAFPHALILRPC